MKNKKIITAGCLFSGMGGFSHALRRAGIRTLWANEINTYACHSFRFNYDDVDLIEGDVRDLSVDKHKLSPVFILTAGFPCQSFSQAGNKAGFEDERGQCFYEIPRLLKEFGDERPLILLLENVPNLVNGGRGMWFDKIIHEIQKAGYWFKKHSCRVLNTVELTGIPQHRPRLFMVAFSTAYFSANFYEFPDKKVERYDIDKFIDRSSKASSNHYLDEGSRYYQTINKEMERGNANGVFQLRRHYARENKNLICPALTANMGGGGHNKPFVKDPWGIRRLTVQECLRLQGFRDYIFPDSVSEQEQYRQIGNAVTVPLAESLIEQAKLYLNDMLKVPNWSQS